VHTGGTAFRVEDLYNPEINVRYGAWYLRHLLEKYGDERTALAAYNAGQDNVDRWRRGGQVIQFAETRAYVQRVEELKKIYRDAYGKELDG
jgi:soluble lytic murein transglycosylase